MPADAGCPHHLFHLGARDAVAEVLVKMAYAGICHSDERFYTASS
jgi:D-arabinose 1-dehydrogenase-like Zn-dependent alcohol dehydrogenase